MLGRHIEEFNVLGFGSRLAENHAGKPHFRPIRLLVFLKQFSTRYNRTLFVDRKFQKVVLNIHRTLRLDHALCHGFRARSHLGNRHVRLFGRSLPSLLLSDRRRTEKRRFTVVDLPVVPQHENSCCENHPQDGALKIASHFRSVS